MRCPRLIARFLRQLAPTRDTVRAPLLALALALVACAPAGPRDIRYGEESCGYCRMTITDRRFGGQVASARGKVQAFDAVECLADYVNAETAGGTTPPRAWVTDFTNPGTFIPVDSARFIRLARASSPMGAGLAAVAASAPAGAVETEGAPMTWAELLESRRGKGSAIGSQASHPSHGGPHAAGGAHAD